MEIFGENVLETIVADVKKGPSMRNIPDADDGPGAGATVNDDNSADKYN